MLPRCLPRSLTSVFAVLQSLGETMWQESVYKVVVHRMTREHIAFHMHSLLLDLYFQMHYIHAIGQATLLQ